MEYGVVVLVVGGLLVWHLKRQEKKVRDEIKKKDENGAG